MKDFRILAVAVLFALMLGIAYHIEVKARPIKNVVVTEHHGDEHDH